LVEMEYRGTGRVRLSEFYGGAEDASWSFTESVEYLRALGALDETDPSRMSVIIPNFIVSQTNCVTPSSLYTACCLNECEGLMASLEGAISGPAAEPSRIAELVSAMPSDTVDAPRAIHAAQLRRLEEIAALHGGTVPLHGRLFAQWMHHAYPRECPYPHLAGVTSPMSPDEWIRKAGSTEASDDEMRRHAQGRAGEEELAALAATITPEAKAEALPWISVEELVVAPRADHRHAASGAGALTTAGFAATLVAAAVQATKVWRAAFCPLEGKGDQQHFV